MKTAQRILTACISLIALIGITGCGATEQGGENQSTYPTGEWSAGNDRQSVVVNVTSTGGFTARVHHVRNTWTDGTLGGQLQDAGTQSQQHNYTITNVSLSGEFFHSMPVPTITLSIPDQGVVGRWQAQIAGAPDWFPHDLYFDIMDNGELRGTYQNGDGETITSDGTWKKTGEHAYSYDFESNTYAVNIPR